MVETHDHGSFQKGRSNYKILDKNGEVIITDKDMMCDGTYKNHENIKSDCDLSCKNMKYCHEIVDLLSRGQHKLAEDIVEILSIHRDEESHFK